ncbi:MAG: hypothetical protein NZ838_11810, partial [Candidatus Marinimicrobia bacterium]|nr:hypothetical protein [Candidatus Neomarinimicrobiota bacterium]
MKHFITSILLLNCYLLHAQTQLGSDIDGEAAGEFFGASVSMKGNDSKVVVPLTTTKSPPCESVIWLNPKE